MVWCGTVAGGRHAVVWQAGSRVHNIEEGRGGGLCSTRGSCVERQRGTCREELSPESLDRRAVGTMASARTAPTAFGASRAGVAKEAGEVRTMVVGKEADDKRGGACVGRGRRESGTHVLDV